MNIAIFSGEVSGDLIGGALATAIRRLEPEARLWGLGSGAMRAAGVDLLADSAAWGAIGIVEAAGKVPGLLCEVYPRVKRALRTERPDVVVPIDFGAFNVRVARYSKQLGLKVCYYFPPGAWRRAGKQGANLAAITDLVATPFPWSETRLRGLGVNAVNVGHPLLERVRATMTREAFAAQFGMDAARPILGLLPGSRRQEVAHLMPTLLDAARLIYQEVPGAQFVVGVAPSISSEMMAAYLRGHTELRERLAEVWHEFASEAEARVLLPVAEKARDLAGESRSVLVTPEGVTLSPEALREERERQQRARQNRRREEKLPPPTVLAKGLTYDVMAHSDLLLTCSGTATLEAAIFATPMIILYRGSKLMEVEYRLRGLKQKIAHIGLPNILADRRIVPELIQWEATPEAIAGAALPILNDFVVRKQMKADLAEVRAALGTPGASERAARLVLDLAKKSSL
jgi:lipid-A-disaccharide synthase